MVFLEIQQFLTDKLLAMRVVKDLLNCLRSAGLFPGSCSSTTVRATI